VAMNDREEVVEIMGDAAGELADGLHFLGLAELGLEAETLGDVDGDGEPRVVGGEDQRVGVISIFSLSLPSFLRCRQMRRWCCPGQLREPAQEGGISSGQRDVPQGQGEKLLVGVAIVADGRLIGGEKNEAGAVADINRAGVVLEQQSVLQLGGRRASSARRRWVMSRKLQTRPTPRPPRAAAATNTRSTGRP